MTRQRLWLWGPPLVYMGLIFHLSSESDPLPALTSTIWDKALHFVEYGGLGVLLCRALIGEAAPVPVAAIAAIIATSLYGASDEWHQLFTPGRSADVYDWLTDTIAGGGGVAAYLFGVVLSTVLRPRRLPRR
jgi:VanZ family protein